MTPERRKNFDRLLKPKHIAFIGGTDAIIAIGEARRRGFSGLYWAVNPKRDDLAGLQCYASVDDLPEPPDAVYLAVPALAAVETIAKLSAMGAGGVVCYTAGFKESGKDGIAAEEALKNAIGDMALIGPNCYGMINYLDDVALWPFAHGGSSPGYGAAIITQSGMFSSDITMSQRSLPLTHMISAGNQTILDQADFIDFLCENPAVKAIGVHIEGLQDIPKFEQAALKSLTKNTPIVALKTGSSVIGSTLTVSHTGSLSGSNELYEALFDRTGVVQVKSPSQFLETLKYLCVSGTPKGKRVAGFTCSGGGATMLADHAENLGIEFSRFSSDIAAQLKDLLPRIATVSNPLDYTTPIWGQPEFTAPVFKTAMDGSNCDAAILVQDYPATGLDESKVYYLNDAKAFAEGATELGIPAAICSTIPENMDEETREYLMANGVAPMQGIHEALNAISAAANWEQARTSILTNQLGAISPVLMHQHVSVLDEVAGKKMLADAGVTIPTGRCVSTEMAAAVADEIGYPIVLKMVGPKLAHKTEAGAVVLNLTGPQAVMNAVEGMKKVVSKFEEEAVTDRFLIEKMAPSPLAELIVGIRCDPQFGYSMTIGSGGILAELIGDTKTLLLPTSQCTIKHALGALKVAKLLNGYRGRSKVDIDALSDTLLKLADFVLKGPNDLIEVEINPLFVYEKNNVAVDALIQVGGELHVSRHSI